MPRKAKSSAKKAKSTAKRTTATKKAKPAAKKKVKLTATSLKSRVMKRAKLDGGVKPADDPGGWSDTAHDDTKQVITGQDGKDS
jgi:hypothetical protein